MKIRRKDVLTPANATSIIGLTLTIYGALNLTTLSGVLLLGLGRIIDVFDGKIARATHTSRFGAAVDAVCDKVGLAFLVPAAWVHEIAPYWLLIYIILQNVLNMIFSALTAVRGGKPTSSQAGKYAMFAQNLSLGSYALASVTSLDFMAPVGLFLGLISLYWAAPATYGYFKMTPAPKERDTI